MDQAAADRVKQIREYLSKMTPGPWQVAYMESSHRKGSPICEERCGQGAIPIRIEQDTPENAARNGWPGVLELHVLRHVECVEDILSPDEKHAVCLGGHDYEDFGHLDPNDAEGIAALRTDAEWLLSQLSASEERVRKLTSELVDMKDDLKEIRRGGMSWEDACGSNPDHEF